MRYDLTGQRFNRFVVIGYEGEHVFPCGKTTSLWKCRCDCGKVVVKMREAVKKDYSCGCMKKERQKQSSTIHGGSNTKLYGVWQTMKNRCYNKNVATFPNYGGRGIKVCDEWNDDFASFKMWADESGYKDGLTIERINNDGNYEPSNCRWATIMEQSHNKRNNHYVEYKGRCYTLAELGRLVGVDRRTIADRLKRGLSVEEAIVSRRRGYNGTQKDWI